MNYHSTLLLCGLLISLSGCTARNTRVDYFRGGVPQTVPKASGGMPHSTGTDSSPPVLQSPGTSYKGGPMLLSPEPIPDPQTRREPRRRFQTVSTDPWGRPQNRAPRIRTADRRQIQQQPLWRDQFQSTLGRSIQTVQIGIGSLRVLVLASLRGTDPTSVTVVSHMAQAMHDRAELQNGCTALFVRNPNPDGIANRSPKNGRGIDLNRNFPAENWRRTAEAGSHAASEIETRVIVRLIDGFRPDRIVIVQVSRAGGAIHYAGPARQLARKIASRSGAGSVQRIVAQPGSLASFVGGDRRLPFISILLERQLGGSATWNAGADGLMMALTDKRSQRQLSPEETGRREHPGTRGPVADKKIFSLPLNSIGGGTGPKRSSRRLVAPIPVKRGYFDLPPPRQP